MNIYIYIYIFYCLLRFCSTRWLEDVTVAECGKGILPNIVKLIKHYESSAQSYHPKNKSYETLVEHYSDKLIPVKLQFFIEIAEKLRPFLTRFQTEKPMLPFMICSYL